nr:CpsD/CapB family tyrosine-protein kinase [candidate division Zixibacteria bacterium]
MAKKNLSIIEFFDLESPESTEFRRVLHSLNGTRIKGERRAILVTSAMLSEGKSIVSSFLAMTSARDKKRKTLLIDFDLRRPMVHKLFSVPLNKGIADIVVDGVPARNVIKKTSIETLDLVTAGRIISNPSDFLTGAAVHKIIEEMKFYYELILVDCPPVLPVIDPMLLLDEMDGAILVVKAGSTQRDIVLRARDLLASQKNKIIGVIVNNINETLPYHYNYSYYGYHYRPAKK